MNRRAFLFLTVVWAAGCGGAAEEVVLDGRYNLETVNGSRVPAATNLGGTPVTIQSGFFQLDADGTFTFNYTMSAQAGGTTTTQQINGLGVWVQNDHTVQFNFQDGSTPEVATINGNVMSLTSGGVALTFRR